MKLGTLVENINDLQALAKKEKIPMNLLGNLQVFQMAGKRAVLAESIKLSLVKDEKGNFLILKTSYNTPEDEIARVNRDTNFL